MNPGLSFVRVMDSEFIKFRTLRSSWVMLLSGVLALFGLGLLGGWNAGRNANLSPGDVLPSWMLEGYYVSQLLVGVLGVLLVTGEYGTGLIRSTLVAVPRRVPVLLAKAAVLTGVSLVTMSVASVATYVGAESLLRTPGHPLGLTEPGVLRVVLGTGLYLALVGLLGAALGWILRNSAAAITSLLGMILVAPVLVATLPWPWLTEIGPYLPAGAGKAFINSEQAPNALTPGTGLIVLLLWVIGALSTAAVLLKRRDG